MLRVLHIIQTFPAGGCERLLSDFLRLRDRETIDQAVLSMMDRHERIAEIEHTCDVRYYTLGIGTFRPLREMVDFVDAYKPDLIVTWLPEANVYGGLIGRLLNIPVVWGIHAAEPPPGVSEEPSTANQVELSHTVPNHIICCSQAVHDFCRKMRYPVQKLHVIDNGTDTEQFKPMPAERARIRKQLGLTDDMALIGMAAAYYSYKGHSNFLQAAKLLLASHPHARFAFCGRHADEDNAGLVEDVERLGLTPYMHLLGIRDDMAELYSAMDIHTLNSRSESFGLATTEAMACETLCVATEVGVAHDIMGATGALIPAEHTPQQLLAAWQQLLALPEHEKAAMQKAGRARIIERFSITKTVREYEACYREVAARPMPRRAHTIEIVIPTYNACQQLERCIASVLRHTNMDEVKLTVINDGSTDHTANYLKILCRGDRRVHAINLEKNHFKCRPLNIGLKQATTEFIVFLDDDTEVTAGWLEGLLKPIQGNPNVAMVGAKIVFLETNQIFAADHRLPARHSMGLRELDMGHRNYVKECDALAGTCTIMRTDLRDTVGEYDETLKWHEDIDYCIRARLKGYKLIYNGEVTVYHHHMGRQSGDAAHNHKLFNDKWTEALTQFPLADSHPADKLFARATRAIDKKDWSEVHTALAALEALDVRFSEPYWLGVSLYEMKRYAEAVPYLQEVLALYRDTDHTYDAHVLLAWAYQWLEEKDALKLQLKRIEREYPELMQRVQPGLVAA